MLEDRMFETNGQIIYESISGNDKRNFHLTKMFSLTKVLDLHGGPQAYFREIFCLKNFIKYEIYNFLC